VWTPIDRLFGYLFGMTDSANGEQFIRIPRLLWHLFVNMFTQYVCVRGVNILGANATALTVTIVLNLRKFVSLLLSIIIFKNHLGPTAVVGTVFVFIGAAWYSWESSRRVGKG
jgi:UDP-xylose/UDP-N-acetylglucosamine transporter B4